MPKPIIFIFGMFALAACQRDFGPDPGTQTSSCRITRIVEGINDGAVGDTTFLMIYNSSGKLEKIHHIHTTGSTSDYFLQQNSNGQVTNFDDGYTSPIDTASFTYNSKGQLSIIFCRYALNYTKYQFEYGASNLPERVKVLVFSDMTSQWEDGGYFKYNYKNGNIIERESIATGEKDYFEYYEDVPNTLGELNLISFATGIPIGNFHEFYFFNKNMPKTYKAGFQEYYMSYKVDSGRLKAFYGDYYRIPDNTFRPFHSIFFHYECK